MQDKPIYHQGADRSLVILFIQGSDSRDYLQRMVSCDVSKVDSQQGRRGTLLDGKGRIQATFDLLEIDTGYLLVTSRQESEILKTRLESLIILEDVEIDIDSHEWIHIHGDGAEDGVRHLGYEPQDRFLATHATEDGLLIRRPRFHSIGFDLLVKTDRRDEIVSRLEDMAGLASDTDREHGRILLGLPKIGAEIGAKTLPPEVGYGDAVAYDKGCYAGQEVLARIRTYGHVNREIRRIVFATSGDAKVAPETGDDLWPQSGGDKPVAKITSVTKTSDGWAAIASVRYRYLKDAPAEEPLLWNRGGDPELVGVLNPEFSPQY